MNATIDTAWFQGLIKDKGYSQRGFAKLINMDHAALSLMLNGKRKMSVGEAGMLARLLNVPAAEVLSRAGVMDAGRTDGEELRHLRAENERLREALKPFAEVCDAEQMRWIRDEQVLELATRAEVPVSEKLRGRDFRAARAALTPDHTDADGTAKGEDHGR